MTDCAADMGCYADAWGENLAKLMCASTIGRDSTGIIIHPWEAQYRYRLGKRETMLETNLVWIEGKVYQGSE